MKILYFSNTAFGGLALYSHYQANALVKAGIEVVLLCPKNYPEYPDPLYTTVRSLPEHSKKFGISKVSRLLSFYRDVTGDIRALVDYAGQQPPCNILFGSYIEYFSPFWAPSVLTLKKAGFVIGSVLHDPVRDVKLGPSWWHNYSIKKAYSFIDILFLHQKLAEPLPEIPAHLPQVIIPHGPYPVAATPIGQSDARSKLKLPEHKTLILSFGHIRDNKNLDLAILCLSQFPDLHLVVAGQSLSDLQKPPGYYMDLAEKEGVADQISWFTEYIPEDRVADLFSASDGILLTYNHRFHSASGVLNLAASFDKPCIASSGSSPLEDLVKNYSLGVWVDPDDREALSKGIKEFMEGKANPDWKGYREDNSWHRNAEITIGAFNHYFP